MFLPIRDDNPHTTKPVVTWGLIGLCVAVFFWQNGLDGRMAQLAVLSYGIIPADLFGTAHLDPIISPLPAWMTMISYMFLHGDLMHLAVNMLVLFFFGPPLEGKWGEREFLRFFIVCGLGGAALSYVFMFSSAPIQIVGASGAGYGIMLGFAMSWPDAPIYIWGIFPVKAKYLVGFFFVLSAMSAVQGTGGGVAHFAHLGGLLAGFGYLKSDWRPKQGLSNLKKAVTRSRRLAIVPGDEGRGEEPAVGTSARSHDENPALYDKVDVVLDKISAQGMSSLTSEELKLLDEVSKKHRTN